MASDIWGFTTTFLVSVCFLVACSLTTETDEETDNGIIVCIRFRVSVEIVRWENVLRKLIA